MSKAMMKYSLSVVVCLLLALTVFADGQTGREANTITLNGVATRVYFNDGDTFKVLDGSLAQSRVRIMGMNTLETYGPIHLWLKNSAEDLLDLAHQATTMARNGTWTCLTEGKKDAYGRLLATCDDLALSLIAHGYAHAYSVDAKPAPRNYLNTQAEAQKTKVGIWKNGIPEFVITSLHSAHETDKESYNRLISTKDGHSKKWVHYDNYETCEKVCLASENSCMVYVPYEQRYGNSRPHCLR